MVWPAIAIALLLDRTEPVPEALMIGRVTGAALLSIGVSCWLAQNDTRSPSQLGLLVGVLFYDLAAAALMGYAGVALNMVGVALWPAVVLHAVLAAWCVVEWWPRNSV
jgi:hypothetical protein